MRKVTLSAAISLDSFIARHDGSYDWIQNDQDYGISEFFSSVDTVLIGRKMHDQMIEAHMPCFKGLRNYVFSRTKSGTGAGDVEYVNPDLKLFIDELKKKPGKDIWLSGGGDLAGSFMRAGLIEELRLAVQPVLLGDGISLFSGEFPQRNLRLLNCRQFSSGVLGLTYSVAL